MQYNEALTQFAAIAARAGWDAEEQVRSLFAVVNTLQDSDFPNLLAQIIDTCDALADAERAMPEDTGRTPPPANGSH